MRRTKEALISGDGVIFHTRDEIDRRAAAERIGEGAHLTLEAGEFAGVEGLGERPVEDAEEDAAAEREDEGVLRGEAEREGLAQAFKHGVRKT
jgi:hypothetical protein